ncbi:MAG: sulfatase, partial [Planctomycetota bacterium]|nr:sulfatase [Planctomycetota bacterium]
MEAALRRFAPAKKTAKVGKPNFVLIFADDLGYADLGCYGNEIIKTPNIDRMARQGMRFTDFYAQTVCGPSRAALMTGCYPLRVAKSRNRVDVHPRLHTDEITIAEILKEQGYKTGCFGKWDLAGHLQKGYDRTLLPTEQGFDYFFGTPTSNDRLVHLLENDKVIERSANMATLTSRYTRKAMDFIETHKDEPFFVYIPHTMPHTKLAASKKFNGKSPRGLYGDVIEEIDFNVGRILKKIETLGLDDKTYVIFTSDNGPWWIKKEHGGKADPLRGAKTSIWEGGVRVPFIIRAPKNVPAGTVCTEVASTMDMLPTMARLGGGAAPSDRVIDGHDIGALIHGEKGAESPTKALFHYAHTHLQAVRSGKWKLHLTRPANPAWTPNWARHIDPEDVFEITSPLLYDLDADIGETTDVAAAHP